MVQCMALGRRQNGRREVEREVEREGWSNDKMVQLFKNYSGYELLSSFFNLSQNAVIFFQLSMIFIKLL